VAKSELGTKRVCPDTGRKFYDLNKTPVVSPYTGKIVPIAAAPVSRSRPEAARAPVPEEVEVAPEAAEAEFVSLEDADAEQQGKKKPVAAGATAAGAEGEAAEDEDVEIDESLDDAAFIEEEEEGNDDVTDIIGESIEKEEES
jgi:uncharacterized protein (TIGR02300 family)